MVLLTIRIEYANQKLFHVTSKYKKKVLKKNKEKKSNDNTNDEVIMLFFPFTGSALCIWPRNVWPAWYKDTTESQSTAGGGGTLALPSRSESPGHEWGGRQSQNLCEESEYSCKEEGVRERSVFGVMLLIVESYFIAKLERYLEDGWSSDFVSAFIYLFILSTFGLFLNFCLFLCICS